MQYPCLLYSCFQKSVFAPLKLGQYFLIFLNNSELSSIISTPDVQELKLIPFLREGHNPWIFIIFGSIFFKADSQLYILQYAFGH